MPYTPPASQSPATSLPTSPSISRSQSYHNNFGIPQPKEQARHGLPRSISSTQYIQRHRRSPSFPQTNGTTTTQDAGFGPTAADQEKGGGSINGSLRQSPPPVSNTLIPPGAIMSPPESPKDGSDDETPPRGRSARVSELRDAVREAIQLRRGQSPTRAQDEEKLHGEKSGATSVQGCDYFGAASGALSPEARKISHSRSATESSMVNPHHRSPMASYSSGQSSEDSDSDEELSIKPPMVRKKSGELVRPALRPSSRRPSSMPGTPTYTKAVHFKEAIEQVRHFLKVDRPIAVSAGSSPVETFDSESEYPFGSEDSEACQSSPGWEIRLANFPSYNYERKNMPVRVEQIFLAADQKTLIGTVAVANIAFQKSVTARFTLDYWKTTSEVAAEYDDDIRKQPNDGYDIFKFNIRLADLANLETKTMFICVRYNVNGQVFWDNNNFTNFQIDFIKKAKSQAPRQSPLGARPIEAIPRSRHSPHVSAGGRARTSIDDKFEAFTSNQSLPSSWTDDSPSSSIRLKKSSDRKGSIFPGERHSSSQAFGNRYDFSKSLTTALTHAQDTIGSRNVVDEDDNDPSYLTHNATKSAAPLSTRTPVKTGAPALALPVALRDADVRPALDSEEYKQMLNQMCFFASGTKAPAPTPTSVAQPKPSQVDGAHDDGFAIDPRIGSKADPDINTRSDSSHKLAGRRTWSGGNSPNLPRSSSPASKTGGGLASRTASPVTFSYPYYENYRFTESHMPPAIRS